MNRLIDVIRHAPLASFFVIAFVFTWALLPWAATSIAVSLVALCGPAVSAMVVTACEDRERRREFQARLTRWRLPLRWYVFVLLLPLCISAMRSGVEYVWEAGGDVEFQPISVFSVIVFVLVAGEEIGWRGFALPRLLPCFGPWGASVLLGILWAFWHLPLFFMPGMPQHGTPFFAFIFYTIALSVILTLIAMKTHESMILATLFHGAVNTFGLVNPAAGPTLRGWSNAVCYGLAALMIGVVAWKIRSVRC